MTIRHQRTFEESAAAGFDGVFDWDFLLPAFNGTKIQPMDIDCIVERNGKFLCFETKSPGKEVPKGQLILFETLVKLGVFTIIFLQAKTVDDICGWDLWTKGRREHRQGTANDLLDLVIEWREYAEK